MTKPRGGAAARKGGQGWGSVAAMKGLGGIKNKATMNADAHRRFWLGYPDSNQERQDQNL